MLSERSTTWATSPLRKWGANAICNLSFDNAIVERSSFAYRSKIGFVVAGHQSICFSHANRLHFRLRCLTGGVQRSYLFHTEVLDSLISRVTCPSTSLWGKPWGFGAPIAFSAGSVLFQMLPFSYWTYKPLSSFGLTKQLPVFRILISSLLWKIWRWGASTPVPMACKASGLPFVLHPRWWNGELMTSEALLLLMQ